MSEQYDLKKSSKGIGQLYPVIVDKVGNVIDGIHRQEADPDWRTEVHREIDTEEKFLVARCVSNWHRRQVSREEKEEWINGLARIYKKQELKVSLPDKISNVTGLAKITVYRYLGERFKEKHKTHEVSPKVSASQVISKMSEGHGYKGEELVERHREEVKADLKTDVDFMSEAVKQHPEVVSKAIRRVSEKVEPTEAYIPPKEVEKIKKRGIEIKEETKRIAEDPKIQQKRRLFKNLGNLQQIAIYANEAVCPNCGAVHQNLVWKCCDLTPEEALEKAHEKLELVK